LKKLSESILEELGKIPEIRSLLRKLEERERKRGELLREFRLKQISFLERNRSKRFELSPEAYDACLRELEKSFRFGEEMGMLILFEERGEVVRGDEFYDSNWIVKNRYGCSTPFKFWVRDESGVEIGLALGSFGFDCERLYGLAIKRKDLLVTCHTHPCVAVPSEGDLLQEPYCGAIIGFERTSKQLKRLVQETFCKMPRWERVVARREDYQKPQSVSKEEWEKFLDRIVGKEVMRRVLFEFPKELYKAILEECSPTVRLFYTHNDELKRVPLYVDGRELG
jgi:hypothetical protein